MKKIFILLSVLLFGMIAVSNANAYSVVNGDFETVDNRVGKINNLQLDSLAPNSWDVYDAIPGWTAGANTSGIEVQYSTVVPAHSPYHYVELDSHGGTNTNSSMYQTINFAEAGDYTLSFWYKARTNTPNDNGIDFSIAGFSGSINEVLSDTPDWVNITMDFTATVGNHNLQFMATGLENSLGGFIDDVSIAPVPEPATMLLLGFGLIGLAGVSRKKFQK